ncbi:acyl-CoA dehydrogenase [Halobacteriales archaeon QS_5_70_15]|jgi:acyl-CoA dehydrogenase|nr:MAG: acyl-CoA dehydrogenase [Halobacteriales archaeon QS_5_70_15]
MDFEPTEEQEMMAAAVHDLVSENFGPEYWREKEYENEFPTEYWEALAEGGWLGLVLPEEYGGQGLGALDLSLVIESICAAGAGAAGSWYYLLTPVFGGLGIARHGTEAQKERYLPGIVDGTLEFCMGLTEPDAGTNTLAIETRAERDGDEFVINGRKMWTSGADRADAMLLITRTKPLEAVDRKTDGITLFVVDMPADGVEIERIHKLGYNYSNTFQVFIDDLRVHEAQVLGTLHDGWRDMHDTINVERIVNAAGAVGTGELVIDTAVEYANEREVFDEPIGAHQGIQFPLAKLKSRLETARVLNHKAAWQYDTGRDYVPAMNMAKYEATETAFRAADQAMQTHGGVGYAREYDVERWWRELRLLRIAPVTQQMALNYVGQHVLGLPRSYGNSG